MRRLLCLLLAVAALTSGCGGGSERASVAAAPLRVGIVPNVAPDQQRAAYAPFG